MSTGGVTLAVDTAPRPRHAAPGVLEVRGQGWFIAGLVDGDGSWGAGVEAAEWCRRRLAGAWSAGPAPTAAQMVADVERAISELPSQCTDELWGQAFSVALVVSSARQLELVIAGSYGALLWTPAGVRALYRPRTWVDVEVERGTVTAEAAATHAMRFVIVSPGVAEPRTSALAVLGPFALDAGDVVVIASPMILEQVERQPETARTARDVQRLLARAVSPVVLVGGAPGSPFVPTMGDRLRRWGRLLTFRGSFR